MILFYFKTVKLLNYERFRLRYDQCNAVGEKWVGSYEQVDKSCIPNSVPVCSYSGYRSKLSVSKLVMRHADKMPFKTTI